MIGDKIFNFKKVLLEAGFFEELKKQFGDLDKFLEDNAEKLDDIATSVGQNLAQAVTGAVCIGQQLIPTLQKVVSILKSIKDGFMALPEFAREVGLVGAFLFGKKGAVALAGVSFIIDKINDFIKDTKTEAGIIDINNLDDVEKRLSIINDRLKNRNQIITETITLNNGVTHEVQTQHALSDETIKLLEKEKKQLQTILFLRNNESTNQFELHKGLKSISVTQDEVKEKVKKTLDLRKHMQEIIRDAENKEMEKQLFIQTEINKKKREFNRIVTEAENKIKNQKTTTEQVTEQIKQQNEQFSISREITNVINKSVSGVSRGFAEALVLGKNLNMTMKELAQSILVDIVAKTIERIALKQIEKFLDKISMEKEADKENLIRKQNTELKRQIALQMFLNAIGGGGSGGSGIPFMANGGAVSKGQPVVVGERGAEVFVPNSTGQIQQSARGTGSGAVNVNFTINTIDSRGFSDALQENRGTITGIINNALAEKGRSELV